MSGARQRSRAGPSTTVFSISSSKGWRWPSPPPSPSRPVDASGGERQCQLADLTDRDAVGDRRRRRQRDAASRSSARCIAGSASAWTRITRSRVGRPDRQADAATRPPPPIGNHDRVRGRAAARGSSSRCALARDGRPGRRTVHEVETALGRDLPRPAVRLVVVGAGQDDLRSVAPRGRSP